LPFGRLVVNLNEPMLIKFLSVEVSIQTDAKYETEVKAALEARKPILNTWLTSHLADKSAEDIRGKVGLNRLRREIQDNFNSLLFKDGHERIQDIMFDEFHVQ
jgi:flagellar basal body-associated protein FliL